MSDADKQEDQYPASPAQNATPTKGAGRGGRGRGRGRGRRRNMGRIKAPAPVKKPVPGGRRGRIKQYSDPAVQAAYERQREVKSTYQAIISHVKPALEELASRNIDTLKSDPEAHKRVPEYRAIKDELLDRRNAVMRGAETLHHLKIEDLEASFKKYNEFATAQFTNAVEDEEERFIDAQLERLHLLEEMHDLGLPPDLRANDYRYKKLSKKGFTERGTYVAYKDGKVVPYPSRVPGTDMFNKARAAEAAQAAHGLKGKAVPKVIAKGRVNGLKRRAQAQPESQPGAKRATRSTARAEKDDEDDDGGIDTPDPTLVEPSEGPPARHIQGLLTAAIDSAGLGDSNAATPRHSPDIEEEDEGADRSAMPPRMRTPEPPKGLSEFDDQGAALMQRGPKANNRLAVKPTFQFDPIDIGFRDSTNDHAKIKNASARGKYLDQPNTDNFFYDPLLWNYDARNQGKGDLDKALVAKFGVHAKYGLFVPNSRNPTSPSPSEMTNSQPVVFLPPNGETLHASRSYQAVVTARNVEQDILTRKMTATLDALYESNPDLSMKTRKRHEKEIPERYSGPSLGLIRREVTEEASESGSEEVSTPPFMAHADVAQRLPGGTLTPLVKAAIMASEEDASARRTETPARRPYDAIRDVFTSSSPKPQPQAEPPSNLSVLADVCGWGPQPPYAQYAASAGYADQGHQQHPYHLPQLATASTPVLGQPQYAHEHPQYHSRYTPSAREQEGFGTRPDPYSDAPMPAQNIPAPPAQYQYRYETPGPVSHREPYRMSVESDMEPRQYQPGAESMIDPRLRGLDHERPPPSYYDYEAHRHAPAGYPPPPPPMHGHPAPQAPLHTGAYGAPPPPPPSHPPPRREYPSSSTTLPPLRPPRQLGQPYESPVDRMGHPHQRISSVSSAGPFYPPGPPPQFHNSFGPPEQPPQMMGGGPSPYGQQPSNAGYRQGTLSPTYSSAQIPLQSLAPTPPPATPPDAPASLGPGSSRRASFHPYAPATAPSPQSSNAKYRKLEPAPIPAHRVGWNAEPQLRTVGYNPTEDIKDYSAIEPLPGRGPTFIRGWNVNSGTRKRGSRGGRDEKEEPR